MDMSLLKSLCRKFLLFWLIACIILASIWSRPGAFAFDCVFNECAISEVVIFGKLVIVCVFSIDLFCVSEKCLLRSVL